MVENCKIGKHSSTPQSVAVIGAGIAGATLAHALQQRGHKPILLDGAKRPGSAASGNPAALIAPRLTPRTRTCAGAHYRQRLFACRAVLRGVADEGATPGWEHAVSL